jgi:aminoglycoside phosphotransferase
MKTNLRNNSMLKDADLVNKTLQAVKAKLEQGRLQEDSGQDESFLPEENGEAVNEFLRYMKNPRDALEDEVTLR